MINGTKKDKDIEIYQALLNVVPELIDQFSTTAEDRADLTERMRNVTDQFAHDIGIRNAHLKRRGRPEKEITDPDIKHIDKKKF